MGTRPFIHPYMPNSVPEIRQQMLDELGLGSVKEIYGSIIPEELIFEGRLDLPEPIMSEYELKRHVKGILNRNTTTDDFISFLGAGCYRHQIPAICDELNSRGEFLTAYCGDTYSDHGKMQAFFEYCSMMGELLDLDVVSYTTYDGGQAASSSMRTALRVKEAEGDTRDVILITSTMDPQIRAQAEVYCQGRAELIPVGADPATGRMDLEDLQNKLSRYDVAAVYYENPSYLGFFETGAEKIAEFAHAKGALCIAQTEVASLGIVESPANLGADIVCGDIQPLGMHQQFGGGQAGFIACRNEVKILEQLPTYMYGICRTEEEGKYGWGRAMNYRCSHGSREKANEYFGTVAGLWAITAGIYLASMGPQGMYDLGASILQKTAYAIKVLRQIQDITVDPYGGCFQEFIVDYSDTGLTAAQVNKQLLDYGIFGGKDLSRDFPELGQSALFCISELTTEEEIEMLRSALSEITGRK